MTNKTETLTSNPLGEILPKLRSAVAAMERLNYTDAVAVLRAGLDWSVSDSGQRRSLTSGDMRNLLVEVEALQRNLDLRNEQIDGYERQLGIDKAGAEHTIGSEIERLRRRNERICGIIARLNTAEGLSAAALSGLQRIAAAATDAPSDETVADSDSEIPSAAEVQFTQWLQRQMPPSTIIGSPTWWAPRIFRAVQNAMRGAQKARVVPSVCGKPMPDGKGAGQCINIPGHEGECDDMPW